MARSNKKMEEVQFVAGHWKRTPSIGYRIIPIKAEFQEAVGWMEGKKVRSMVSPYDPRQDIRAAMPGGKQIIRLKMPDGSIVECDAWRTKDFAFS